MDLRITPIWWDYIGRGIKVGVIDDGTQLNHPDLAPGIVTEQTWDVTAGVVPGGGPTGPGQNHGTAVAGLIGARWDNGTGGTGVAPGSQLTVYRINLGSPGDNDPSPPDSEYDDSVSAFEQALRDRVDVINNSWGSDAAFARTIAANNSLQPELAALATEGRNGLGTIVLFAQGNSRAAGNDGNLDNILNDHRVIAVAAAGHDGVVTSYSTAGANLLVTGFGGASTGQLGGRPGNGMTTTDRTGADGYTPLDHTFGFDGTSAATPVVSGVVALMLQANRGLGYRDVQEILALSARATDLGAGSWVTGHQGDWNGGGQRFSRDYGFGVVDAHAAVRMAEAWSFVRPTASTEANLQSASASLALGDAAISGAASIFAIDLAGGIEAEHVELTLGMVSANPSLLSIALVSPSGTVMSMLESPGNAMLVDRESGEVALRAWPGSFKLSTPGFWGEKATGTWKIAITDGSSAGSTLSNISLRVLGDAASSDDLVAVTNDFAALHALGGRSTVLGDGAGVDTVFGAALMGPARMDLSGGPSVIQGVGVTFGSAVANLVSGDGDDVLIGDAKGNLLVSGPGKDALYGGSGSDRLVAGAGHDLLSGGAGNDTLEGGTGIDTALVSGSTQNLFLSVVDVKTRSFSLANDEGTDLLKGVEALRLGDGRTLGGNPGLNGVDALYYLAMNPDVLHAGVDPATHYAIFGWREGRDPSAFFSTRGYLEAYGDVRAAAVDPLNHYIVYGWNEGRVASAKFDTTRYLSTNADVAAAGMNPLLHLLGFGLDEGRVTAMDGVLI